MSTKRSGSLNKLDDEDRFSLTNSSATSLSTPMPLAQEKQSYFIFKSFKMSQKNMLRLTTAMLLLSIFTERYCFIVTVYKMKYYGYVLILSVIALNCIFNLILAQMRMEKTTKALHELFSIDRTPSMGSCIIGVIG